MAITTTTKIRLLTNLSTSDISDADLTNIIAEATKEIMSQINVKVTRERVDYLDETRQNDIDDSNKTYYVKNWKGKFLGDYDLDGDVDVDDLTVYAVDTDGNETEATVSSVTVDEGKFVLSTAYSGDYSLYVTYAYTYFDPVTPDPLLQLAATYLVAAYAHLKVDTGASNVRFGNVSIRKELSQTYGMYWDRYQKILNQLNARGSLKKAWKASRVKI